MKKLRLKISSYIAGITCIGASFLIPSQAEEWTTLIPISVGDITLFIPVSPKPSNIESALRANTLIQQIKWTEVSNASYYLVNLEDKLGNSYQTITHDHWFDLDSVLSHYKKIEVTACNKLEQCGQKSVITPNHKARSITFVHTDLLGSPIAESKL